MRTTQIKAQVAYAKSGWPATMESTGWLLYVREVNEGLVDYCDLANHEWDAKQHPGYYRRNQRPISEFAKKVRRQLTEDETMLWFILQWFDHLRHTVQSSYVKYPQDRQAYCLAAFDAFAHSTLDANGLRWLDSYKKERTHED